MKHAWTAFLVTAAVFLPARIWTLFHFIDPGTSFFTDGGITAGILALLLAGCVVFLMRLCDCGVGEKVPDPPSRSTLLFILSLLCGIAVLAQSAAFLSVAWNDKSLIPERIFYGFGFLASAAFLTAAFGFSSGKALLRRAPLIALLPSVWGCLGLVLMFIRYAAAVDRLENLYHTFTAAFLLLFLVSQAKIQSGVGGPEAGKRIYAYGLPAVTMTLVTAVPNLALDFAGKETLGIFPIGMHVVNLFLAAYAAAFLASLRLKPAPAAVPVKVSSSPKIKQENVPEKNKAGVPASSSDTDQKEQGVLRECLSFLNSRYGGEMKFVEAERLKPSRGTDGDGSSKYYQDPL